MDKKPHVIILGSGPGSVFSWYGALAAGYAPEEVQIWGPGLSYPPGAFWLHQLPPNAQIEAEPQWIYIKLIGSAAEYSRLQWGSEYPTSASTMTGRSVKAYNPHVVLPQLFSMCNFREIHRKFELLDVVKLAEEYETVIVTFPITAVAVQISRQLQIPVYTKDVSSEASDENPNDLYCIYNGDNKIDWVRCTKAFGKVSVEYPTHMCNSIPDILASEEKVWGKGGKVALVPEMHPKVTPLRNVVLGGHSNILLTGRWATLKRSALSHNSWGDVNDFLVTRDRVENAKNSLHREEIHY